MGPTRQTSTVAVLLAEKTTGASPTRPAAPKVFQFGRPKAPATIIIAGGPRRPAYPVYFSGRHAENCGSSASSPATIRQAPTAPPAIATRHPRYGQTAMASSINSVRARKLKIPSPVSGVPNQARPGKA